ncbi:MAG: glycosyltransferase family 4 protein [Chloroflexota bacterium]|nr:glycosyltransferase family 4 protein [Chloroflexota bacterium]
MRVVVIGINYPPEVAGIAPQTAALCRHLSAEGHTVHVLTAKPHYPAWRVFAGYRQIRITREVHDGVRVTRVPSYIPANPSSMIRRLLYDGSFALIAGLTALRLPRADIYLYVGAQPAVALAAALLARFNGRPWVAKVADLAVSAGAAVGLIPNRALIRLLRTVEYAIYRRADVVFVLTEGFAEELARHGVCDHKLHLVRDSEDVGGLTPTTSRAEALLRNGLNPDRPLVTHIGSMGRKQGLRVAVQAANDDQTDASWLFVGDGPERPVIERLAPAGRTCFLPFVSQAELADILAASDVALLTQRRRVIESVIPSKLITYMTAGLPVVASVHVESEAARLIRRSRCGLVVEPEASESLRSAIDELLADPNRRRQLGAAGRAFAEREFDRSRIVARQAAILDLLASGNERNRRSP